MNIKTLKISELKPYKNNPRKNEEAVEQVANIAVRLYQIANYILVVF